MKATIDLTPIIQVLITLLATWVTLRVVPWLKAKTTSEQYSLLLATTKVLVYAAEQIYGAGGGKEKLLYVKGELMKKGYAVDVDSIEAMVREMKMEDMELID